MSDRDNPTVPVTTLAGLTSLSDLLSELPVSDSLSSVTSLNKSLLFHALVAEEANNLLSVRDDNLVKQLVNAIEQTNSDNIEIKSQYAINQHGTNISGYPELLQGIYNFRPTVFNTPINQRIQNQQAASTSQVQQHSYYHQQNSQQQQQIQQQQQQQMHKPVVTNMQQIPETVIQNQNNLHQQHIVQQKGAVYNAQNNVTIQQFPAGAEMKLQPQIIQQVVISPNSAVSNVPAQNSIIVDSPNRRTRRQAATDQHVIQNQPAVQQSPKIVQQIILPPQHQQPQPVVYQMTATSPSTPTQRAPVPEQMHQQTPVIHQNQIIQNVQQGVILQSPAQSLQKNNSTVIQQQSVIIQQPKNMQQQTQPQINHRPQTHMNPSNPHEPVISSQTHIQAQAHMANNQSHQPQQTAMASRVSSIQNNSQMGNLTGGNIQQPTPPQHHSKGEIGQKTVPRNSEYVEQSKKFDLRGPSPVQASIAPESEQIPSGNQQAKTPQAMSSFENQTNEMKQKTGPTGLGGPASLLPKVRLTRLSTDDERLLQHSLKKFAQKSPDVAKEIGLIKNEEKKQPADMFSMMKLDERRLAAKRKLAVKPEELCPEKIYSQPKVRRVERIVAPSTPKCSKEEVMRSQAYQQFMKNMEQIIEQLDDTEQPNFNSEETDETIECISSKMLNAMSNDVAKLKAKGVLDSIPKNKLTLLINYAMRNVYLAKNYAAGPDDDEEIIGEEIMEKILNAIEACLLICNIYSTAKDLKFLQEDNVTLILKFLQFQLRETIFPSYDPVYTVKTMKKADQRKKTKSHQSHNRSLHLLYSKTVELMKVLVTLFDKCVFVDTIVLSLSTMAIEPFFVDNIDTLQFVCLELVTTIFRKEHYEKIRTSILTDIFTSIDRLPCSKKNLRPFKLANNGGNIQMVTALVLQLIQCATILPDSVCDGGKKKLKSIDLEGNPVPEKENIDALIMRKYEVAIGIGANFLQTFLSKCKTRSNDTDFRPMFENFIHDLLATVNKPEWPAAELLLSLLGTLLVKYTSDKSKEQSIRLASLDYLGIVAARLRKDTVESRCKVNIMDAMIKSIKAEQEKEGDLPENNSKIVLDPEEERTEFLQKILLDYLAVNAQEENLIWDYARHFYLVQWCKDIFNQRKRISEGEKGYASRKRKVIKKKRRRHGGESSESSSDDDVEELSDDDDERSSDNHKKSRNNEVPDQELNLEIFKVLDERKKYLLRKVKPYSDMNCTSQHIKTYIDYNNAHLIAQYLASKRPFSQSFDKYLVKIILIVNEPAIAIRTRAMKCLSNIVEVDPLVLKRKDMQMGVNQKFLDSAISVREAAVDLVGKFVLSSEELIDQYYEMLSTRILDTGVSVRKRVIKILRDICIEYPDFEKIPEICVKMIRRVNDEEGIQKLVTEVFMKMWFTACKENDRVGVQRKINQIIDVVNTAHDTGTTWLEGLLASIFTPKENMQKMDGSISEPVKKNTEPPAEIVLACQQLADGLVQRLIELDDSDSATMLGCITTLHLLAKARPQLLVRHAITIEPYLNIKCQSSTAQKFICAVADILEQVVPLVVNPSESFLATLEEHLMLLVVSMSQFVVSRCVSCLGALVNKITKNYKLIRDCFSKFYRIIEYNREQVIKNPNQSIYTPPFRRSLFTIGILMRHFDFKSPKVLGIGEADGGISPNICDQVYECLMFFMTNSNPEICKQALISLGFFCVQNDEYLTRPELKMFYCDLLQSETADANIKILCMRNIWVYLTESEIFMHNKEKDWEKQQQSEDLKEMNDVSSGMASRIIQLYLDDILNCFLSPNPPVRLWAVKVVHIVLRQGLVHPIRMVPYLICLSTDEKQEAAHRADALLKDIEKTYPGYVHMKAKQGLQLSFDLQKIVQCRSGKTLIRGYTKKDGNQTQSSLNDFLYTLLRASKSSRRSLILAVTKQFNDQTTSLQQMLYLADNLAYFPYAVQDEPLYLINQIDIQISNAGTNLLSTFKEGLKIPENERDVLEDDDDEEDPEILFQRLPDDTTELQQCIRSAQGCMLMLILKEHLKEMYGLTDGRISRYSPSETQRIYEKAISRKNVPEFNPKSTIEIINKGTDIDKQLDDSEKRALIARYLDFKQLMLKLDPDDADSLDEDAKDKSKLNNSVVSMDTSLNTTGANNSFDGDVTNTSVSTPHDHSVNNSVSIPIQNSVSQVTSRTTKSSTKSASPRKQPQRQKRKKRKIVSSDDDEDDDSYDEDYA